MRVLPTRPWPGPGVPVFSDDFTGTLNAYLQLGSDTAVLSSGLKNTAANTPALIAVASPTLRNFHATIKYTSGGSSGASTAIGLAFGIIDASNFILAQYETQGGSLSIYRCVAGSFSFSVTPVTGVEASLGAGAVRWFTVMKSGDRVVASQWSSDPLTAAAPLGLIDFTAAAGTEKNMLLTPPRRLGLRMDTPNTGWSINDFKVYL